jgi:hypothetical protein
MGAKGVSLSDRLRVVNPGIAELRATRYLRADPGVTWRVGYAPEEDEGIHGRIVIATLQAFADDGGGGAVTVTAVVLYADDDQPENDDFADALASSEALETLYDIAVIALRTIQATVKVNIEIPFRSPEPLLTALERANA